MPQASDLKSPTRQIVIQWPTGDQLRSWLLKAIVIAACVYFAYLVRDIWVPLILAFLLATVLDPVVDRLEVKGWSRMAAASLIYAVFLLLLITGIVLAYPHIVEQIEEIQKGFMHRFPDTSPAGIQSSLQRLGASTALASFIVQVLTTTQAAFRASNQITQYGWSVATNLIWIVIVPIIAFYALRDYHVILGKALLVVPRERRGLVETAVADATAIFGRYLRGMAIVSLINGAATWLLLWLFHIPSALVIGIGALILYNIPYLGAIAINVLIAIVSFLSGGVHGMLIVTGVGLVMHNVLFDQIITPRILGGHVGLHPILTIVAILVGNLLLGVVGMILAVPVAACIQIGVLAVVPKLKQDLDLPGRIDLPNADEETQAQQQTLEEKTATPPAEETMEHQAQTDATQELHRIVTTRVENIEDEMDGAAQDGKES